MITRTWQSLRCCEQELFLPDGVKQKWNDCDRKSCTSNSSNNNSNSAQQQQQQSSSKIKRHLLQQLWVGTPY
eukprot:scaffold11665_cov36-Attheya_sp.AAC.3